jgi:hypothetical protein
MAGPEGEGPGVMDGAGEPALAPSPPWVGPSFPKPTNQAIRTASSATTAATIALRRQ